MAFEIKELRLEERPFLNITQSSIKHLERISPADKALAVPIALLWELDPENGSALHHGVDPNIPSHPLSIDLVTPPQFGVAVSGERHRFSERPAASLERIEIDWDNPNGLILYRRIKLSLTVHRPDVVFSEKTPGKDSWSSLIIPGKLFALKYGWNASKSTKSDILNGTGISDEKTRVGISSTTVLRFVITNYTFQITQDNQIRFEIDGFEDGESQIRQGNAAVTKRVLQNLKEKDAKLKKNGKTRQLTKDEPQKLYGEKGQDIIDGIQKNLATLRKQKGKRKHVKLEDAFQVMVAPLLDFIYGRIGYSKVNILFGSFNTEAGSLSKALGNIKIGDVNIRNFPITFDSLTSGLSKIVENGEFPTPYNTMRLVLSTLSLPASYGAKSLRTPQVVIKTVPHHGSRSVDIYIVDLFRESAQFNEKSRHQFKEFIGGGVATREKVKKYLDDQKIPVVSVMGGNTYIQDSSFSAYPDDQIKSIFIERHFKTLKERGQIVTEDDVKNKINSMDAGAMLYSSAIQGTLTMLGNFCFDVIGLVWIDFGIYRWSGAFNIMRRQDTIERGSFSTQITVQSTGGDPLGTQAPVPKGMV